MNDKLKGIILFTSTLGASLGTALFVRKALQEQSFPKIMAQKSDEMEEGDNSLSPTRRIREDLETYRHRKLESRSFFSLRNWYRIFTHPQRFFSAGVEAIQDNLEDIQQNLIEKGIIYAVLIVCVLFALIFLSFMLSKLLNWLFVWPDFAGYACVTGIYLLVAFLVYRFKIVGQRKEED